MTVLGEPHVVDAGARREPAPVAGHRASDEHHSGPGHLRTPAEVDVLASEGHACVEAAQPGEQFPADEQHRRRQGEGVAHAVVLLLVELVGTGAVGRDAEAVDVVARMPDGLGAVPFHDLWADDPRVAPQRLDHEGSHRVGGQGHVVVAHQQEVGVQIGREHRVGRLRESRSAGCVYHGGVGQDFRDPWTDPRSGRVNHGHAQGPVVLEGQRLEGLAEPLARPVGNHHGQHRRFLLGGAVRACSGRRGVDGRCDQPRLMGA